MNRSLSVFLFFKQKTSYEMRISDWSSDVCSSDLTILAHPDHQADAEARRARYLWVSENVNRARDLINEPANVVTPDVIAALAGETARELELEVEEHGRASCGERVGLYG